MNLRAHLYATSGYEPGPLTTAIYGHSCFTPHCKASLRGQPHFSLPCSPLVTPNPLRGVRSFIPDAVPCALRVSRCRVGDRGLPGMPLPPLSVSRFFPPVWWPETAEIAWQLSLRRGTQCVVSVGARFRWCWARAQRWDSSGCVSEEGNAGTNWILKGGEPNPELPHRWVLCLSPAPKAAFPGLSRAQGSWCYEVMRRMES